MRQCFSRWMAILAFIAISLLGSLAYGEKLNVLPLFKESFAKNASVTMVSFSGEQADWKGLSLYKSVSVSGNDEKADEIASCVRKDGVKAEFKETSYKDGKLYFGFYGLGGEGHHRKYLFFLDLRPKGKEKTTLIYIEGDWTPDQVKNMIIKKIK